jgi:hypothetical protein
MSNIMKKGTFAYICSANSAIILIFLVYLFTLANMSREVTAQGQPGFIPAPLPTTIAAAATTLIEYLLMTDVILISH